MCQFMSTNDVNISFSLEKLFVNLDGLIMTMNCLTLLAVRVLGPGMECKKDKVAEAVTLQ